MVWRSRWLPEKKWISIKPVSPSRLTVFNQETNENIDIEVEGDSGEENPEPPTPPVTGDDPTITIPQALYTLPADEQKNAKSAGQSAGQFMRNYRLNLARELIIRNRLTHNMNISEMHTK